jgi:hypothetical protein
MFWQMFSSFTNINGPNGRNYIFQIEPYFLGTSKNKIGVIGQSNWLIAKKKT